MTPNYDFNALTQSTLATINKTNTAAMTGFEQLTKLFIDLAGKSFEETTTAGKQLASIKTPQEFFQVQSKLTQEAFATFFGDTKKVAELATAVSKDVSAPIADHFKNTLAVGTKAASLKKAA